MAAPAPTVRLTAARPQVQAVATPVDVLVPVKSHGLFPFFK